VIVWLDAEEQRGAPRRGKLDLFRAIDRATISLRGRGPDLHQRFGETPANPLATEPDHAGGQGEDHGGDVTAARGIRMLNKEGHARMRVAETRVFHLHRPGVFFFVSSSTGRG